MKTMLRASFVWRLVTTQAAVLVLAFGLLASVSFAEGYAYDLAGELMSPYCPGRTLSSCPSPQAAELVQWISIQEAAGASQDEVVEQLIERFGEEILGAPPAEGITLWAYIFPVAGFLGGGGIVAVVLRRMIGRSDDDDSQAPADNQNSSVADAAASPSNASPPEATAGSDTDDELARLVDAELAGRR